MRAGAGLVLAAALAATAPAQAEPRAVYEAEIAAIARRAEVRAAFAALERGRRIDNANLVELNQIPAPPFAEAARARRFAELLRAAGLGDVAVDAVGNVIARRRGAGEGPTLALIAHLDTVFPEGTDVTVRIEGDTFRAPGVADNARGLVFLIALARALGAAGVETRGDLLFVGSVGEEGLGDLRGVKHLFAAGGPRIDSVIAVDGADAGRIVNAAVGSLRYRVSVRGPGGHSWSDFGAPNPHHALARIIASFDERAAPVVAGARASYNVGRIGGGTSVNSIPFESWAEIDMRALEPRTLAALEETLRAAVETGLAEEDGARSKGEPLAVEIERVGERPAGSLGAEAQLVQRTMAAMRRLRVEPRLGEGSTDANVPLAQGVPAITISGGGAGGGAHSPDEWWRDQRAHVGLQIGLLAALAEVGLAH